VVSWRDAELKIEGLGRVEKVFVQDALRVSLNCIAS